MAILKVNKYTNNKTSGENISIVGGVDNRVVGSNFVTINGNQNNVDSSSNVNIIGNRNKLNNCKEVVIIGNDRDVFVFSMKLVGNVGWFLCVSPYPES